MDHGPATQWKHDRSTPLRARLGFWLFLLYALIYAGFILLNVTNPNLMAADIGSFNLAIIYGFGLIGFALILAVIYNDVSVMAEDHAASYETDEEVTKR